MGTDLPLRILRYFRVRILPQRPHAPPNRMSCWVGRAFYASVWEAPEKRGPLETHWLEIGIEIHRQLWLSLHLPCNLVCPSPQPQVLPAPSQALNTQCRKLVFPGMFHLHPPFWALDTASVVHAAQSTRTVPSALMRRRLSSAVDL